MSEKWSTDPADIEAVRASGDGCIFEWAGPGTRWVKVFDDCDGHCSPPTHDGLFIGQQAVVSCDP